MAGGRERFAARARERGIEIEPRTFPQGTRTAADAAAAIGCAVGQIVKSLVLVADDAPVLVLTSGASRVDPQRVATALGAAEARMATAEEVRRATGYGIGGTPPFGHDTDLVVLCDVALLEHERVWAAAGTPHDVFGLTPDRLVELAGARAAAVAAEA